MKRMKSRLMGVMMLLALASLMVGCSSGGGGQSTSSSGTASTTTSAKASDNSKGASKDTAAPAKEEKGLSSVRIGTSSSGSIFYSLAIAASKIFTEHTNINSTVEPVGGSDANMFGIQNGKIELGISNGFATQNAFYGKSPYKKPIDVRLVAQGQSSFRQILVRTNAGINSPADLAGKKIISKRPALPELSLIANALFKVYGLDPSKMKLISTANTSETSQALKIGSVDAAVYPGSLGSASIAELIKSGKVKLLEIPDDKIKEMQKLLPTAMKPGVIPAGTYPGQKTDVNAFYFNTYLVAGANVPDSTVYQLTKAFFENHDEYAKLNKAGAKWTLENTLNSPSVPFHNGSIKYFKEVGKWTDDLQKTQDAFLKKAN